MTEELDRNLHDAFDVLRRETEPAAPGFRATLEGLARRRERVSRARRRLVTMAVVAAGLLLLVLAGPFTHPDRTTAVYLSAAHWDAPTDFLLRTPGADLLSTMPTLTNTWSITP